MTEKAKTTLSIKYYLRRAVINTVLVFGSVLLTFGLIELLTPALLTAAHKGYLQRSQLQFALDHLDFSAAPAEKEVNGHQNSDELEWMEQDNMHPYLGFVRNSQADAGYDNYGFLGEQTVIKRSPDTVIVGVFGGSVAWYLYQDNQQDLINELQKIPQLSNKKIKLVSVALGGYKQPQQTLALNYILSLGGQFDIVINVDGFNDAALPFSDNYAAGITPNYPRAWDIYSRKTIDLPTLAILGETSNVQGARAAWAAKFKNAPLRSSQLALFIWYYRDNQMNIQLQTLNTQLETALQQQTKNSQVQGPTPPQSKEQVFDDSLSVWRESSLQMARLSEANGAKYYHVLQPNQYLPDSKTLNSTEKTTAFVSTLPDDSLMKHAYRYKEAVEKLYPEMRKTGQQLHTEHNVNFFDMTQVFKDVKETIYIDPCCHYNDTGSRILIKKMTELIAADYANQKQQSLK